MITIHELGHYLAGKWLGFNINEFAIGFGPKLFSKKSKKTGEVFSIRAIPLGGFCAFEDEDGLEDEKQNDDENKEVFSEIAETKSVEVIKKPKSVDEIKLIRTGKKFNEQPPWKRIIVLAAGGIFNLLAAVVFSFIFILVVGLPEQPVVAAFYYNYNDINLVYSYNEDGTPHLINGQRQRLYHDDIILQINGRNITYLVHYGLAMSGNYNDDGIHPITTFSIPREIAAAGPAPRRGVPSRYYYQFTNFLVERTNSQGLTREVSLNLRRWTAFDGEDVELRRQDGTPVTRRVVDDNGNFVMQNGAYVYENFTVENYAGFGFRPTWEMNRSFGTAIVWAVPHTAHMSWLVLGSLGQLVTGRVPMTYVTGPVGTITTMAELSVMNWRNILLLLPLLAANLGIFNLLPIPALDGSKIIFTSIEWIRKKPINKKVEMWIHVVGMFILFGFVILADVIGMFARCGL